MADEPDASDLKNVARDIRAILLEMREVVKYMRDAESEVPERMRRFMMYFHDAHDAINFHHELGLQPPKWLSREVERCADRLKHLLDEMYDLDKDGTFERVRQDMTQRGDGMNRYDWTKQLTVKDKP